MPKEPYIIALVATLLRAQLLGRLLESLDRQSARPSAVVICDNGPDPATAKAAGASKFPCELLSPGRNLGFGGGLAAAGRRAFEKFSRLTHLLVVDDDAILAPDDLRLLLASAENNSAGTVAPFLVDASGKLLETPEPVSWTLSRALRSAGRSLDHARALAPDGYPMAWCVGPCVLIEKSTWLRAGPPRTDMLAFGDDIEFSLRLSAASRAWSESSIAVVHDPPQATDSHRNDGAHYRKFGMLLQNLAFTCVISPKPRHLPLYLPGNAKRFLKTFGFSPANFIEVLRRYGLGFLRRPAGL